MTSGLTGKYLVNTEEVKKKHRREALGAFPKTWSREASVAWRTAEIAVLMQEGTILKDFMRNKA